MSHAESLRASACDGPHLDAKDRLKHSWDGKEQMLRMQPCRVKKVAEYVSTPGESRKDGKGQSAVASGQRHRTRQLGSSGNHWEDNSAEAQSSSGRHNQTWQRNEQEEVAEQTKSSWLESWWADSQAKFIPSMRQPPEDRDTNGSSSEEGPWWNH